MSIDISNETKNIFQSLLSFNRIPQSIIIEGGNEEKRKETALFLSCFAVCSSENDERPCYKCTNCIKAEKGVHSDIFVPQPEGKTQIITMKNIRDNVLPNTIIVPNEADKKVFIFHEADKTLREDTQNTLLKTIEEPIVPILFIFTCEKANSLLSTIRSRSQIFTLNIESTKNEESDDLAREILKGIISLDEISLLYATTLLTTKEKVKEIIPIISNYLLEALSASISPDTDDELIILLSRKLSRQKIIALIEENDNILKKANTNINNNLLNTYICTRYRRISWRK